MFLAQRLQETAIQSKVPFWLVTTDQRGLFMSSERKCVARIMTRNCVEFYSREINGEHDWQVLRSQLEEFAKTEECKQEWRKYQAQYPGPK